MEQKCYIAGKISGLEYSEFSENFRQARVVVEKFHMTPVCPLDLNKVSEMHHSDTWKNYLKRDIKAMMDCDCVYAMKNWKESKGATIEVDLANALGIPVFYQENPNRPR